MAEKSRRKNVEAIYPLSSLQEGMLFHTISAPNSGVYVQQIVISLQGDLDYDLFEQTWQMEVDRQPVFRTSFWWKKQAQTLQIVRKRVKLPWQNLDWSTCTAPEEDSRLEEFLSADRKEGFDPEKAPLLRCTLISLSSRRYIFVLSLHHIILDGWSLPVVLNEVFTMYTALREEGEMHLVPVRPFKHFITWLQSRDLEKRESFWRQYLSGFQTTTPMVMDRRPGYLDLEGKARHLLVREQGRRTITSIEKYCRQLHITKATLLQGAWGLLLSRYSGHLDVVFGISSAGRPPELPGIEQMVGLFINTLPVRIACPPHKTVRSWLQNLHKHFLELREYEHSSLIDIQGWTELSRKDPLFESMVAVENYPVRSIWRDIDEKLSVTGFNIHEQTNLPLALEVLPSDVLKVRLAYDGNRFHASSIENMVNHYCTILDSIVANHIPEMLLGNISLLTGKEAREHHGIWIKTETEYPCEASVQSLFEKVVTEEPDRVAVNDGDHMITYSRLNKGANLLAHDLLKKGIKEGSKVGLLMERSLNMIVVMIGILKTGGMYVPLDPGYPSDRLRYMIDDAQITTLVTDDQTATTVEGISCPTVTWPPDKENHFDTIHDPAIRSGPDSVAYLMYTSGSTGRPKGIAVPHRAIIRLVMNTDYVNLTGDHVFAQASNASFDAATFEIWGALLSGNALCIVKKDDVLDLSVMADLIKRKGVSILFLTTSLFNLYAGEKPEVFSQLRYLLFGGEAVDPQAVRRVKEKMHRGVLLHVYGPTENTTFSTWHRVGEVKDDASTVPIGIPVANSTCTIFDCNLEAVPPYVPGELYLGGHGLATCYHDRPALTADRFRPATLSPQPGERFYNSGDIVLADSAGNIEFIGRRDSQVKVRGFRVETEEIEHILNKHSKVKQAIVMATQEENGMYRLLAYVVPTDNMDSLLHELRHYLKGTLPEYMHPSFIMKLKEFPLNPNGKIDRQALPLPSTDQVKDHTKSVIPRDHLDQAICSLFLKALDLRSISIRDNFFDLGGHSLTAMKMIPKLEKIAGKKIPVTTIYQYSTVEELADMIRKDLHLKKWRWLQAIQPLGCHPPLFWIMGTTVLPTLTKKLSPDFPFYLLRGQGYDGLPPELNSVEEIAEEYLNEILEFYPTGPCCLGSFSFGAVVAFEIAHRLEKMGRQVDLLMLLDPTHINVKMKKPWLIDENSPLSPTQQLQKRFIAHGRQLTGFSFEEKLTYVFSRLANVLIYRVIEKGKDFLISIICRILFLSNRKLPPKLVFSQMRKFYGKTAVKYQPLPSEGKTILWIGEEYKNKSIWPTIVEPETAIHSFRGRHDFLADEKYASQWISQIESQYL